MLVKKIMLIGFGRVGKAFVKLLINKSRLFNTKYQFRVKIIGISDPKYGVIYDENGLNLARIIDHVNRIRSFKGLNGYKSNISSLDLIEKYPAEILVEVTWSNLGDGEPGLTHILTAIKKGMDVITTNKGPFVIAYREIMDLAKKHGVKIRYEGTVMSGTPVISLLTESLRGAEIRRIRGILNGTTNFILTEMERGLTFSEALKKAQELGYAEADPSLDIDGLDPAAKSVILFNSVFNGNYKLTDAKIIGIRDIDREQVIGALKNGFRIKLISNITSNGVTVMPEKLASNDPLYNIGGVLNAIVITTEELGDITISGRGAGPREAAQAIIQDLISLVQN